MNITEKHIVGELVAADYRTASVFKHHKIDFCCKGNRTIAEACEKANINPEQLMEELSQVVANLQQTSTDFALWDIDLLADYIEKKHHRYVEKRIPEITAFLLKIAAVHGERHPELIEIGQLFAASARELGSHMQKEEMILFPYIRKMARGQQPLQAPFGTVQNPVNMMMQEHSHEGERFRTIARLSDDYTPPADACTTYRVAFAMLKEFEEDLHLHIHLENNILFPRAVAAEQRLATPSATLAVPAH